jgi:hypothetical protein
VALQYLDDANPLSGATSVTPPSVAATLAEADHVFICVNFKRPGSATLATPGGWTKIVDVSVGTGAVGAGTGPVGLMVFYAQVDATGAITLPTLTLGGTTTNSLIQAATIVYRGDGGLSSHLEFAYSTGSDTVSDTTWSITGDTDPGIRANDRVVLFGALSTGSTVTFSANPTIAATGVTFGSVSSPWLTSTNTGDDARSFAYRAIASAGASSAAPTSTGTLDGASTGGAVFMRLREDPWDHGTLTEGTTGLLRTSSTTDSGTLSESAAVWDVVDKTATDSGALSESSTPSVFFGGEFFFGDGQYFGEDQFFGDGNGNDSATLVETSSVLKADFSTASDSGALTETAEISLVVTKSATDSGTLTETASIIEVTTASASDALGVVLDEVSSLSIVDFREGTDSGTLAETAALAVFSETDDVAHLTEDRLVDRPNPAAADDAALVEETAQLTVTTVASPFYFAPDKYFGPDVYFGGGTGVDGTPGVEPDGGDDPDRDHGFTASHSGDIQPADYAVLVFITTTGQVVDELHWSNWSYSDSVDWARPGSMTVTVPLLGRDRLGRLTKESLRNIRASMHTVSLVLTRQGRALWAGPVYTMAWGDDSVSLGCASVTKVMDSRVVIAGGHLLSPNTDAANFTLELSPRDRVIKLLELGTTGSRRQLPLNLPTYRGDGGTSIEYVGVDLGTVSERVKEAVEADGGPDVVIRPELSYDQAYVSWDVQVEQHFGNTKNMATWSYPYSVRELSGDADASQIVSTGYVLGDTSTSVGNIRGVGVSSVDLGELSPAMERADRTSASNKSQDELDALAVSFQAAHSVVAETWSVSVHPGVDPIYGVHWNLGDRVTVSVSDHPWLDDGEYVRRVVGITHTPDSMTLETVEVL